MLEETFPAIILGELLLRSGEALWLMLLNSTLGWKILWGTLGVQFIPFMEEEIYDEAQSFIAKVKVSRLIK